MKKLLYLSFIFILLLTNCSNEKKDFTLKGKISNLSSDTVLLYYQVPDYKLDTLYCKNGTFEYSFSPDTFTVFSLIFDNENSLPIFAEKGEMVEIHGSKDSLVIKGKGENELMNKILSLLRNCPQQTIKLKVDSIIRKNSYSFTNIYLIDKYYLHEKSPDYKKLDELINSLGGIIKDTYYIMNLQSRVEYLNSNEYNTRNIHTLLDKNKKGETIKWTTITRNKYTLLDFWASWNPESIAAQDSLERVLKALNKENFQIVSLSLDIDKEAWLKASKRDTDQWIQVCSFKGWNTPIVKSQKINQLPYNLLLDKNKHIVARNLRGQELINKVKELIKKDKEREKATNQRKK